MSQIPLTISVRMNVALSVYAERAADGTIEIVSVCSFVGLPDPGEILEAMDSDDLVSMDAEFEAAEASGAKPC